MSSDNEDLQTNDVSIRHSVEDLRDALDQHVLINLVAPETQRQQILEQFTGRCGESLEIQRVDGLMHNHGDLVDVLREFSRPRAADDKKVCILVDHWSEELIGTGDDELFSRWFHDLDGETHTLVLGTDTPLASSASERLRKLIPSNSLASMHISRPTVTNPSGFGATEAAAGLGAALLGRGSSMSAAAFPGGAVAASVSAIRDALGSAESSDEEGQPGNQQTESEEESADERQNEDSWFKRLRAAGGTVFNLDEESRECPNDDRESGEDRAELRRWLESEDFQQFLPGSASRVPDEKVEELRELMEPAQLREFVAASTVEDDGNEQLEQLVDVALEADRWANFLRYLNRFDARLEVEAGETGFALEQDQGQHLATYLAKVGYEPEEFVASLFRTSDLVSLFPYFDPSQWEPQQFLENQFELWKRQKSVPINEHDTGCDGEEGQSNENNADCEAEEVPSEPRTLEIPFRSESGGPVRRLFEMLEKLNGSEALETNLNSLEDYATAKGPIEPRFCEWVYRRIEERALMEGLAGEILRPSDVRRLRKLLELSEDDSASWSESLRDVLGEIGVQEPGLPPHLDSGFSQIRRATKYFSDKTAPNIELETYDDQGSVTAARKGIERFLKLYVTFLWHGGLSELILQVIVGGRQGFNPAVFDAAELVGAPEEGADTSEWSSADWKERVDDSNALEDIQGATAGVLNYLLQALARECGQQKLEPPFLRRDGGEQRLWPDPVFQRIRSLITTLNKLSHDDLLDSTEERRRLEGGLAEKFQKVVKLVDDGTLRVPRPVQFFRRHDDGHGIHYEGYTDTNEHMWFYEVEEEYGLNEPYLFLAATNPSAVDVTCVSFPTAFQR